MEIEISLAKSGDAEQMLDLMREFAVFERLEHSFKATPESLHDALFGARAFAAGFVARCENRLVAFAIGFPVLKTFRGERSFYLEDLYVKPEFRGRGCGLKMLQFIAAEAKKNGCLRMDWQALEWNTPAIEFYRKIGAETDAGNVDFRLIEENFIRLAS